MRNINFNLYRYQILPKDRYFQGTLFGDIQTVEDLIEQKNVIFDECVKSVQVWKSARTTLIGKLVYSMDNFFMFKFAPKRTIKIENQTFEEECHESYPSFFVAIWNNPDKQLILIQDRKQAFSHTQVVVKILMQSINALLVNKQLKLYVEPIFHKEAFWKIVDDYPNLIKNVRFELITPNMANISSALSDDLKNLAKGTNTAKTLLELDSDDSRLHISETDKQINSIVNYASDGGGNISVKVRGVKKRIQTSNSIKSLEINELEISNDNFNNIANLLKRILDE